MEKPLPSPAPPSSLEEGEKESEVFKRDFLCVSEFCEQEGPIPRFVIPESGHGQFPLNEFVVRIMAVDHQKQEGSFSSDSQQVIPQPDEGAYCYVHHLTLLDLYARGYVRPICISFVCHDSHKLMSHFQTMLEECQKISTLLKFGNQRLFLDNLEEQIQLMLNSTNEDRQEQNTSDEKEAAEDSQAITNRNLLLQLRSVATQARRMLTPAAFTGENQAVKDLIGLLSGSSQSQAQSVAQSEIVTALHKIRRFDKSLRTINDLCGNEFKRAWQRLQLLHAHFSRPRVILALEEEDMGTMKPEAAVLSMGNTPLVNFAQGQTDYRVQSEKKKSLPEGSLRSFYSLPASENSQSGSEDSFASLFSDDHDFPEAMIEHTSEEERKGTLMQSGDGVVKDGSGLLKPFNGRQDRLKPLSIFNFRHADDEIPLHSFSESLWGLPDQFSGGCTGRGLLALRTKYSFYRHLILALLRGRTLVIHASPRNEDNVRHSVQALAIFVTGIESSVAAWRTDLPLRMVDLGRYRLIGLSKAIANSIPACVERHVTLWDYEAETISTTAYHKSTFVESIVSSRKNWPDEETYTAHVHSVLLDIGVKAAFYFQTNVTHVLTRSKDGTVSSVSNEEFCRERLKLQSSKGKRTKRSTSNPAGSSNDSKEPEAGHNSRSDRVICTLPRKAREGSKMLFCQMTNLGACDLDILEALVEKVKIQLCRSHTGSPSVAGGMLPAQHMPDTALAKRSASGPTSTFNDKERDQKLPMQMYPSTLSLRPKIGRVPPVIRLDYAPVVKVRNTNTRRRLTNPT